ncbi:MAG: LLM class flavin-dependent oxidoreductase [Pseudoxanthomonas sp.]
MGPSFSLALFPSRADPTAPSAPTAWVQCAQAAEYAGIDGLFIATGARLLDAMAIAASLIAPTRRLGLWVAVDPGLLLPTALAASAQSLQALSGGRLRLHLDPRAGTAPCAPSSLRLNRDQRREWSGEYLRILDHLLRPDSAPLDFDGRYFRLERAGLGKRALPRPPLSLDGATDPFRIAAHADLCLLDDPHPQRIGPAIEHLRRQAARAGRSIAFACTLGAIVGPDEQQAWICAERQWEAQIPSAPPPDTPPGVARLHRDSGRSPRRFEIYPNLCRPDPTGPATLVGSPRQVAGRLRELYALGVEHVVLDLYPQLPQLLRFSELVLPEIANEEAKGERRDMS